MDNGSIMMLVFGMVLLYGGLTTFIRIALKASKTK